MIFNSHHLPVQTHHNNFKLNLNSFFGNLKKSKENYAAWLDTN